MRARGAEPQPQGGVGACPKNLGVQVAEAWDYLVGSCAPGVLTSMDKAHLQMAAVLLTRFWMDPMECDTKLILALERVLAKMGMNPSDRSKVAVPKDQKKANPFSAMLGGRTDTSKAS